MQTDYTQNTLAELERVVMERKGLEIRIDELQEAESALRQEMAALMRENKWKTVEGNRISVTVSTRRDLKIADEATVRTYLKTNGLLEEALRLDLKTVKDFAKLQEIPGLETVERETVTVREINKATPEPVLPEESQKEFAERVRKARGA